MWSYLSVQQVSLQAGAVLLCAVGPPDGQTVGLPLLLRLPGGSAAPALHRHLPHLDPHATWERLDPHATWERVSPGPTRHLGESITWTHTPPGREYHLDPHATWERVSPGPTRHLGEYHLDPHATWESITWTHTPPGRETRTRLESACLMNM